MQGLFPAAILLVVVPLAAVITGKILGLHPGYAAQVVGVVGFALAFLLVLVVAVSTAYSTPGQGSRDALGLPAGSIRALLAFVIVAAFTILSLVLLTRFKSPTKHDDASLQVITILGTMFASVVAFYFGTNSVKAGAAALAAVTGQAPPPGPDAITADVSDGTALKGSVHPHGNDTRHFFEYTAAAAANAPSEFDSQTKTRTTPAGDQAVPVSETLAAAIPAGAWYRLVAFNNLGSSTGATKRIPTP
jgi:hypothetical protein